MNDKQICFILCTNNRLYAEECMYYINHLIIPEGYEVDVLTVLDAVSMTSGYNEAMQCSQAKYKVYLHHDTFIVDPHFIENILKIFRENKEVGMIGMVGAPHLPSSGVMWETKRAGMFYSRKINNISLCKMEYTRRSDGEMSQNGEYWEVEAVDGLLMATQYDVPWREDLFDKWDMYDASQSMEFIRRGYKVVVPKMELPWVLHDTGFVDLKNYEGERVKYVQEYLADVKETEKNLVSVVIPTYNRKHTIRRCIDSVLAQTYRAIEVIIVDDCSTDGTMEYVDELYGEVTDINIIYVRNDDNLGASASRNAGVSYANGEYIAFHDSDDEWLPDKLEKQMTAFLQADEKVGVVYSMFEHRGEQYSEVFPPKNIDLSVKTGHVLPTVLINPLVGMITLVMRKDVFVKLGGFNEQLRSLEDYEFTIRIAREYEFLLIDEVLAIAYESAGSVGSRNNDKIATQYYIMDAYKEDLTRLGLKKKKFDFVFWEASEYGNLQFFFQAVLELSKDEDYVRYAKEKLEMS